MKRIGIAILVLVFFLGFSSQNAEAHQKVSNKVQLAILLDTSGSMEGLIEQAKTQLWKIVNELARSKKDGQPIDLTVALYEYGKDDIPQSENYLRMLVPLTNDLDKVSEELFKLTTNGGDEYCGEVIKAATNGLKWSESNDDLKIIYIAGNEEFTQGATDYKESCKNAITKGIIVNTIFCGDYDEGVQTSWKDGADLADGTYINIDHNAEVVHVDAPQDEELIELGRQLNETYIGYGSLGFEGEERQMEQDVNATNMGGGSMVERSISKAQFQYSNSSWDLVDAVKEEVVDIAELKDEELPEEMRGMSDDEKKEFVEELTKKRGALQEKINKLNEDRRKYVAEKLLEMGENNTLDQAIISSLKKQAQEKDFIFEK